MGAQSVQHGDHQDLVQQARDGDRRAFEALVRIHQTEVFTLALRMTGNHDLAGDVAQESFVRAWRAISRFRGDAAFSTWMHRITVNTAWTLRRRAQRHQAQPIDDALHPPEPGPGPEQAGVNQELRARLVAALRRLPAQQRAVVVLKDVYGWSHQEIADTLGITVTAAKVRLHRGRKRLRAQLAEEVGS